MKRIREWWFPIVLFCSWVVGSAYTVHALSEMSASQPRRQVTAVFSEVVAARPS